MHVVDYLQDHGVSYDLTTHDNAYTSHEVAQAEHVSEMEIAKPVVVKADGRYYVCVLPGCFRVNLDSLKRQLGAEDVRLANEHEMEGLFPDCQVGAEPPLGNLYGLATLMDKSLESDKNIVFQAETHEKAIWMSMADYKRLVHPKVMSFSCPDKWSDIEALTYDPFYYDTFFYNPFYPL